MAAVSFFISVEAQAAPVAAGRGRGRGRGRGKARGAAPAAAPPAGSGGRGSAAGYTWVDADKHAWRPRAAFAGEPDPKLGPAFDGLTVYNRPHEYTGYTLRSLETDGRYLILY